ncbi:major capsid protein [Gordonia phage RobinSparkles]|nr:major capsid protein [Gordonia phage RobinSparkles]
MSNVYTDFQPLGVAWNGAGKGAGSGGGSQVFTNPAAGAFSKPDPMLEGLGINQYAAGASLGQLVAQEQHIGLIRELTPPEAHTGLSIAPWLEVDSDDVVIDFINSTGSGLAPARAEDAESELFQFTEDITGQMRASVVDWAIKNAYTASDVTRYRQMRDAAAFLEGAGAGLPLYIRSIIDGFATKMDRDTERRKLWLDNRIEWLIWQAIVTGVIEYVDGKISWKVDFKRPTGQKNQAPASGAYNSGNAANMDPIGDVLKIVEWMWENKGVRIDKAWCSRKFLNTIYLSQKFIPRTGFAPAAGVDPRYVMEGWGPQAAIDILQRETGVTFYTNDNVFRARNQATGEIENIRYLPQNKVVFLPSDETVQLVDNTDIGFAKTLTSPHPMGDFTPGFYSWEQQETDPWQHVVGSGVKAFPVFPHMDKTFDWNVTL